MAVLEEILRNEKVCLAEVGRRHGLTPQQVAYIKKHKDEITAEVNERPVIDDAVRRHKGRSQFPEVDAALYGWVREKRLSPHPMTITTALLQQAALDKAQELGVKDFKASSNWLREFRRRHELVFRKEHGEAKGISADAVAAGRAEMKVRTSWSCVRCRRRQPDR